MIEIQVAGAGAGKTYGLSEKLIDCGRLNNSHKIIYAITYTNSARKKISATILEKVGYIPTTLKIETVHSFFLNEIIYPFSKYATADMYNNAVSFKLPDNIAWKKSKINKLKARNIVHNEEVFKKAKIIIDRTNTKHSNKLKKAKVDFIIAHIQSKISHIFIDESQDLDCDALKAFEILGLNDINIYMIGDPKQAIKYPKDFSNFIFECKNKEVEKYSILEPNNETKRIPNEILKVSNLFCPKDQMQLNLNDKGGSVSYITTNEDFYHKVIERYKSLNKLVYIEKKQGNYETHRDSKKINFPLTLEDKLRNLREYSHLDLDIFLSSLILDLHEQLKKLSVANILREFQREYVQFDKYEYAEFKETLENSLNDSNSSYVVSSIDGVKGLESNVCLFILNESMYKYLIKDIPKSNHNNKNWNKLYVALTRSSEKLILLIDEELFPHIEIANIESNFAKLGIKKYVLDS
jgi:superfamily I DNA/RNA helicase